MPELPEVEVVRRGLARLLAGRTVLAVATDGKALRGCVPDKTMTQWLPGATINEVRRRAKYLLIDFDNGTVLIIHLGMTGKLGIFPADSPPRTHDHVFWRLDNGQELRFNDPRRFGSISLLRPGQAAVEETSFFAACGPEPLAADFSAHYLKSRATGRNQPVKNFLMDNRNVVGIGNIYANESLFAAGIRPTRPAGSIGLKKWRLLVEQIRVVLERAIACGGSTISDFIGASGESGYFQINFNVYDRAGKPCRHCQRPIDSVRLGGRSSFFCRRCQK